MPLSVQQEIEGEWTFGLGDMALSPTMIEYLEAAPLPLARARTQPARPAAALCPVPGAPGNPRVAAAETGRLGQVLLPDLNEPGDEGQSQRAALPCQSARHRPEPARSHRRRWPAGWSQPSTPGCGSCRVIATNGPGHRIVLRTAGALRTARHTVNSSSCWPRSSIAASAGACHLPTKPWSGPISRACPTTDRPTSTMERRR